MGKRIKLQWRRDVSKINGDFGGKSQIYVCSITSNRIDSPRAKSESITIIPLSFVCFDIRQHMVLCALILAASWFTNIARNFHTCSLTPQLEFSKGSGAQKNYIEGSTLYPSEGRKVLKKIGLDEVGLPPFYGRTNSDGKAKIALCKRNMLSADAR